MNQILCDNLWPTLKTLNRRSQFLRAAVGYASSLDVLKFEKDDILICDASDAAIASGQTSAKLIASIIRSGGEVYSLPGLHAKIYLFDDTAVIGSPNLSDHSSTGKLIESAVALTDPMSCAQVGKLFSSLKSRAKLIDPSRLAELLKIPVQRNSPPQGHRKKKTKGRTTKVDAPKYWILGIHDRDSTTDQAALTRGYQKIGKSNGIQNIEYSTKELEDSGITQDDLIFLLSRESEAEKNPQKLSQCRRVIHIEKGKKGKSYLYHSGPETEVPWKKGERLLKQAGVKGRISKHCLRSIGKAGPTLAEALTRA